MKCFNDSNDSKSKQTSDFLWCFELNFGILYELTIMKPITFLQNSPLQRKNNQSQTYLLTNETNEQLTKLLV